jgi:hypothetical protein
MVAEDGGAIVGAVEGWVMVDDGGAVVGSVRVDDAVGSVIVLEGRAEVDVVKVVKVETGKRVGTLGNTASAQSGSTQVLDSPSNGNDR